MPPTQSLDLWGHIDLHTSIRLSVRPSVRKSCVCNSSYTNEGIMTKLSQMWRCAFKSVFTGLCPLIGFYYIHIKWKIILCAQLLAFDCLILTTFVTNSQMWGHWCLADKSSYYIIYFVLSHKYVQCLSGLMMNESRCVLNVIIQVYEEID